jgi:phage gpG-like protein
MKDISDLEKDLSRELSQLQHFYNIELPQHAAMELEALTDQSFQKEKYQGDSKKKWEGRKGDKQDFTKSGKAKPRTRRRGLLVDQAELIRSVEATIIRAGDIQVSIGSDKAYAQIHNEGLMGKAWGRHPFKMTQRQFMPIPGTEEKVITKNLESFIDKSMDRIFK